MSYYELHGASSDKIDVHTAIKNVDQGLFPNAFCKIVPDRLTGSVDHCITLHADGSGTKAALAYLYYKEVGDSRIFRGIAHDSLVMNLDDLLCIGASGPFLLSNTIGRNAKLISGEVLAEIINGYGDSIETLGRLGIEILPCGGETADLGDLVHTLVVDSTIVVRQARATVIDCSNIQNGHVIVGLASAGQATYETVENSGIGTNGFTTARHALLSSRYLEFEETYSPEIKHIAYQGRFNLGDVVYPKTTLAQALLSPTRTYAPIVAQILAKHRPSISGIFHNSGGGLTKCIRFGKNIRYIKNNIFLVPPIFSLIRSEAKLSFSEMCQTFNMGQRLEIVCNKISADAIIAIAQAFHVDAQIIGHVERSDGPNRLEIEHFGEIATYEHSGS